MNISNTPAVQAAMSAAQSPTADNVNILILKKALNIQATSALAMLQALPTLATEGSLGTQVNTFA
jgi:hypothetical protein